MASPHGVLYISCLICEQAYNPCSRGRAILILCFFLFWINEDFFRNRHWFLQCLVQLLMLIFYNWVRYVYLCNCIPRCFIVFDHGLKTRQLFFSSLQLCPSPLLFQVVLWPEGCIRKRKKHTRRWCLMSNYTLN